MPDRDFWNLIVFVAVPIVSMLLFGVVTVVALAWVGIRRSEQEAKLKQEMVRGGMSAEDIERVLRATSKADAAKAASLVPSLEQQAIEQMVTTLGEWGASAHVIEEVLAAIRAADPAAQQATCRTVKTMIEAITGVGEDVKGEQILAVVRGLARRAAPPAVPELAPPPDAEPEAAFQPLRPV